MLGKRIKRSAVLLLFIMGIFVLQGEAGVVPLSGAKVAARNFLQQLSARGAADGISILPGTATTITSGQLPSYYIFTLNPQGFIAIAAEEASYPVLAYSFRNNYAADNQPAAFSDWMEGYLRQIEAIRSKGLLADTVIRASWRNLLDPAPLPATGKNPLGDIAPLLTTTWNQTFPYNALCPADAGAGNGYEGHVPAGCTAIAMAQVMYYWRYPSHGQGDHCINPQPVPYGPQCADFLNTTYDWNGMVNHPEAECPSLETLCYQAGVSVDMDYSPGGSLSSLYAVPGAMVTHFRYDANIEMFTRNLYPASDWLPLLRSNLDSREPVIYYGMGSSGAHIFVCDGYQNSDFFHFNWGWGGSYDGYFYLSNLNPGGVGYTLDQAAVVYIKPDASYYPAFCSGLTNLTYPDFGSIEDGSGPLQNYPNMTDCKWLIAPGDSIRDIKLHFISSRIGPADMLRVYDGDNISSPLLTTISGTSLPPDITSTGRRMLVRLTSMLSTTSQGFLAEYSTTPYPLCKPDSIYMSGTAQISDGSGPYDYRNGTLCLWFLSPMGASQLTLTFNDFDTEPGQDVVTVYPPGSSTPLASYSGSYFPLPPPITTTGGSLVVQFTTNKTIRGKGWSATYTSPVGIAETGRSSSVQICPNPAAGKTEIRLDDLNDADRVELSLFDITGRLVLQNSISASPWVLQRRHLQAGVYLLQLRSQSGRFYGTTRLILTD